MKSVQLVGGLYQCPACDRKLDGAMGVAEDGAVPRPGDFSICIGCGAGLVFTDSGLRAMTRGEHKGMKSSERRDFDRAQKAVRRARGSP